MITKSELLKVESIHQELDRLKSKNKRLDAALSKIVSQFVLGDYPSVEDIVMICNEARH